MEITGDRLRFPALAAVLSKARSLPLCRDARVFQIVFLAALLTIGVLLRDFSLQPLQMVRQQKQAFMPMNLHIYLRSGG